MTQLVQHRPGRNLDQVFAPIFLAQSLNGRLFASTARGSTLVDGLMRQATVKANGDDVVAALNRAHTLGWACGHQDSSTRDALRDLFVETFDVSANAAEIGATLICDRLKLSGHTVIKNNPDQFLKIGLEYQRYQLGIIEDLRTGVLRDMDQ